MKNKFLLLIVITIILLSSCITLNKKHDCSEFISELTQENNRLRQDSIELREIGDLKSQRTYKVLLIDMETDLKENGSIDVKRVMDYYEKGNIK